ncbi:unnamed protein product [Durusdinium trenchii]|uniref:Uncharacterized protein n=2 Tax=Durusdinium trenchii TaxID=1381693 RepID=A0ABP0L181_9DINO
MWPPRLAMTLARRMRPFRAPWHVSGGGGQAARWRSGHGRRSRLEALEALVELDGLLEDELIEKEIHAIQLQRLLHEAGVASREELHSERQVDAVAEELPVVKAPRPSAEREAELREQLRELDELLEDELIEEEVHAEQQRRLQHLLAELEEPSDGPV